MALRVQASNRATPPSLRFPAPVRLLAGLAAGVLACARVPPPVFPGAIPFDVRVRVIARDLPRSWHPGRLIRSEEGCRIVTVATTRQPAPIVQLNAGQIRRLQLSRANPPPDWWTEPEEQEGWIEIDPARLREESDRCRSHYPTASR